MKGKINSQFDQWQNTKTVIICICLYKSVYIYVEISCMCVCVLFFPRLLSKKRYIVIRNNWNAWLKSLAELEHQHETKPNLNTERKLFSNFN